VGEQHYFALTSGTPDGLLKVAAPDQAIASGTGPEESPWRIGTLRSNTMLRTFSLALLGLALVASGLQAAKDKDDKSGKTDQKGIIAKVKVVDPEKGTVILIIKGKDVTYVVKKDTKIIGPRGGVSEKRLKDDRLAKGAEVIIVTDGKTLKVIKLGLRKKAPKKDKKDN
jgi:hypothetical protein